MTLKKEKITPMSIISELDEKVMLNCQFPLKLRDNIIDTVIRFYRKEDKNDS